MEDIKKDASLEMKNTVFEMKITLHGINSRFDTVEEKVRYLKT